MSHAHIPHADLDSLPAVLTVEETAHVLRIGRAQAYEGVRAGAIPSVRFGRTIRIPRKALLALLGEAVPGADPPLASRLPGGETPHE